MGMLRKIKREQRPLLAQYSAQNTDVMGRILSRFEIKIL
jgi:hypothetical protein